MLSLAALWLPSSWAGSGAFGEGYSSPAQGVSAEIFYRAFSLGNWKDICDKSPIPVELRGHAITLRIGERIPRSAESGVVIEAYDSNGDFVAHVPIIVSMDDPQNIAATTFWDDGDYLKAVREGEAEFRVQWACSAADAPPIVAYVQVTVVEQGK